MRQTAGQLNIAAAANLQLVMEPLAKAFESKTRTKLVTSLGSSVQLEQQIENGAPFDVFLSADTAQVDKLVKKSLAADDSHAVYARGVLVLWAPKNHKIKSIQDLANDDVRRIGIANPELAPYGRAAIETLTALNLWPQLEKKVVYGPNISVVAQFADSANADAAFTALSLVQGQVERPIIVPEDLHHPIEQAFCILRSSRNAGGPARQFKEFLLGTDGQAILQKFGYARPQ